MHPLLRMAARAMTRSAPTSQARIFLARKSTSAPIRPKEGETGKTQIVGLLNIVAIVTLYMALTKMSHEHNKVQIRNLYLTQDIKHLQELILAAEKVKEKKEKELELMQES